MDINLIEGLINNIKRRTEEINGALDLVYSLIKDDNTRDMSKTGVNQNEKEVSTTQADKLYSPASPAYNQYGPSTTGYYGNNYTKYKPEVPRYNPDVRMSVKPEVEIGVKEFIFIVKMVYKIEDTLNQNGNITKKLVDEIKNSKIFRAINAYMTADDYIFISQLASNAIEDTKTYSDVPKELVKYINDPIHSESLKLYLYYKYKIEYKHRIILPTRLSEQERSDILNLCKGTYFELNGYNIYRIKRILEDIVDKKVKSSPGRN